MFARAVSSIAHFRFFVRPFDPATYEDEGDEDEVLDEEGRARTKLRVENTLRWRFAKDADGKEIRDCNGELVQESNARFVKWSDGRWRFCLCWLSCDLRPANHFTFSFFVAVEFHGDYWTVVKLSYVLPTSLLGILLDLGQWSSSYSLAVGHEVERCPTNLNV